MSTLRIAALTTLAMLAFAGNSILCRIALKETGIDAASFTSIRLASGAAVLWAITMFLGRDRQGSGNWLSALALFTYAAGFSFAYISLTAATGALMLFGAVQVTMIGYGFWAGERLQKQQLFGFALAFGGLVGLLLPGLSAPPLLGSALMLIAGMAWGVYSIRGKGAGDATRVTAGNFLRASLLAVLLSALMFSDFKADSAGVGYAVASGAITSGLGYAVWYSVVPALKAANAATVQLSVPVIAAVGGIALLGESITLRFALATLAILGGIALVILSKPHSLPRKSA
jgi:drug/metabolite transporter (DMT)-like permease